MTLNSIYVDNLIKTALLEDINYPLELSTAIMISLKISIRSMCARRAGRCVPDSWCCLP